LGDGTADRVDFFVVGVAGGFADFGFAGFLLGADALVAGLVFRGHDDALFRARRRSA
jgi:hypothetical protein